MGNTCRGQCGVRKGKAAPVAPKSFSMGPAEAESTEEGAAAFFAGSTGRGEPKSSRIESGSHGASGTRSGSATGCSIAVNDVDRKSTRGSSVGKVYKNIARRFCRRPSMVGGGVAGRGRSGRWSGPRGRGRRLVTSATSGVLSDKYEMEQSPLGRGFFGVVRKCSNKETGEVFAVKTIQKSKVRRIESLRREVAIMRCVDHPNIVKLYDVFEDDTFIHHVMEMCTDGELFDKMMGKEGVGGGAFQKIIDFGVSRFVDGQSTMSAFIGTLNYMAPEIYAGKYNKACDLWSLGVVIFILLSGNIPFDGENDDEIFASVCDGYFDFESPEWGSISSKAKHFITQLLKKDPCARMTATEAMEHPWLRTSPDRRVSLAGVVEAANGKGHVINMQDIYHWLRKFAGMSELQSVALCVIASDVLEEDIGHLRWVFQLIDEDGDNVITAEEIGQVLRRKGVACRRADLVGLMGSNSDFAAAAVERHILVREENIRYAFDLIDVKGNSEITISDLAEFFDSKEKAFEAMNILKLSSIDVITYEMFKSMMMEVLGDSRGP